MTEHHAWSDAEVVEMTRWHDMEPVRTGFGGVIHWRSRDPINGRHRYRITPSAMPTTNSKDEKR